MTDDLVLGYLISLSAATTFAALLVALARGPLRGALGARAAYWLWLAVPMSALALMLPHIDRPAGEAPAIAPEVLGWAWARVTALIAANRVSEPFVAAACAVWANGAAIALALVIVRQRSFLRSLGTLERLPDGTWRSREVAEPMLIGALRPRVLVPLDFEQHYSAEERELVLAHGHAPVAIRPGSRLRCGGARVRGKSAPRALCGSAAQGATRGRGGARLAPRVSLGLGASATVPDSGAQTPSARAHTARARDRLRRNAHCFGQPGGARRTARRARRAAAGLYHGATHCGQGLSTRPAPRPRSPTGAHRPRLSAL